MRCGELHIEVHVVAENLDLLDESQFHDIVMQLGIDDLAQGIQDHGFGYSDRHVWASLKYRVSLAETRANASIDPLARSSMRHAAVCAASPPCRGVSPGHHACGFFTTGSWSAGHFPVVSHQG